MTDERLDEIDPSRIKPLRPSAYRRPDGFFDVTYRFSVEPEPRPMTDDEAFTAAIVARPEDDLPRLVYADWLDEHGRHDRAAFVRDQVELARLEAHLVEHCRRLAADRSRPPGEPDGLESRRIELRRRTDDLAAEHGDDWVPDTRPHAVLWTWSRGFVAAATATAAGWVAHGDAILSLHPVRTVRLTDLPDVMVGWLHKADGTSTNPRWPGVAFELPNPADAFRRITGDLLYRRLLERYADAAAAGARAAFEHNRRLVDAITGPGSPGARMAEMARLAGEAIQRAERRREDARRRRATANPLARYALAMRPRDTGSLCRSVPRYTSKPLVALAPRTESR